MHINGNAFIARQARHNATGRILTIRHGHNTNTAEDIIWIEVEGQKAKRATGKNIAEVYADIDAAIASGEATNLL
jgi:hypothetical protein